MDSNWQGGDPNRRGAYYNLERRHDHPSSSSRRWPSNRPGPYYNYNPVQPHDHPSSSSRRRQPPMGEGNPLQLLTSYPQFQPRGGYIVNQSSSRVGNISGHDLAPLACPMPGPSYHYSEPVAPRPSMPNVIGSQYQYQPHPGPATVFPAPGNSSSVIPRAPVYPPGAGVYPQQPDSATVFNAPGYNSDPHASVYQPGPPFYAQPSAATDFSAWGGNANNDANQGASRGPVAGVPNSSSRLPLQNQANDLLGAVQAVQRARTPGDLEAFINNVILEHCNGVTLMEVAEPMSGEIALKELVSLAALHLGPEVLQRLLSCLVDGWVMEQWNGQHLLRHFFTTLPSVHCSVFIEKLALPRFWPMVTSGVGYRSMMTCLENAGYIDQGTLLQDTFVANTVQIAKTLYGSFLSQDVFEKGRDEQLMERIRERVEHNVMELSMHNFGNNVVQACFVPSIMMPPPSVLLLRRGLQAFLRLPGEQLRELVQNHCAGYVLRRLLRASLDCAVASEEAMQLAQQILRVGPLPDLLNSIAWQVIHESKP